MLYFILLSSKYLLRLLDTEIKPNNKMGGNTGFQKQDKRKYPTVAIMHIVVFQKDAQTSTFRPAQSNNNKHHLFFCFSCCHVSPRVPLNQQVAPGVGGGGGWSNALLLSQPTYWLAQGKVWSGFLILFPFCMAAAGSWGKTE